MKIAIAGPIATEDIKRYLTDADLDSLPSGYAGAPLMSTLIGGLLARGHEVCAFTTSNSGQFSPGEQWRKATGSGFEIFYCPARPHAFRFSAGSFGRACDFFSKERACLTAAIISANPDIVHAHWSYEFALAALKTGFPHVITCHDSPSAVLRYMFSIYRAVRFLMARKCLKNSRVVTAVSPYIKDSVTAYTCAEITVIPNPLPDAVLESASNFIKAEPDFRAPVIATVINGWGRLKNAKAALVAFAKLNNVIPNAILRMYGVDYEVGGKADKWAQLHGLNRNVQFIGPLEHRMLQHDLRNTDLLLHPSLLEGCPMGIAEAMALGLPIVAGQKSGGVAWVVGEGGILVDVRESDELAAAMVKLLSDRKVYAQCATNAKLRAHKFFNLGSVISSYESLYSSSLHDSRRQLS